MKKAFVTIICVLVVCYITFNTNSISNLIADNISNNHKLLPKDPNEYAKKEGFLFVQLSDDYIPYSYNDLVNIVFTAINNGWESFTFYCPSEYKECINDMEKISKDDIILTHINNYVHPFNSFNLINTTILESGEINLKITHIYSEDQIKAINTEVDRIISLLIKDKTKTYENLKTIHDYIINNTKYDEQKSTDGDSNYASSIAYGTLFEHYATCNGYTDTMAIFMDKLGVKNYKIATTKEDISYESTGHVWNAVYIDGKWLHMDLTWDDPVSNTGKDHLYHKYFLVTNEEMQKADKGEVNIEEHNFRKDIYLEFNEKSQNLS